jgi:hypothetical protein
MARTATRKPTTAKECTRKRYKTFRHATTFSNYVTIAVDGIQVGACDQAAGRKAIWLHTSDKTPWAIIHTMQRHGVTLAEIVVLELHLDSQTLKHHGHGLWYTTEDISPSAIRGVLQATDIAARTSVDKAG